MANFGITTDINATAIRSQKDLVLPFITSNAPPRNLLPGIGGGLAFDQVTRTVYYNDGAMWRTLGNGISSFVEPFTLIKNQPLAVLPNTPTSVSNFQASPSPYVSVPNWDLLSGVYVADQPLSLMLTISLCWSAGFSNAGSRMIRLKFFDNSTLITSTIVEKMLQPSANVAIPTCVELSTTIAMDTDDACWFEVESTAPINVEVDDSFNTVISGVQIL